MPENVSGKYITRTRFVVYWSKPKHTDHLRRYKLTVISEGKPVFNKTVNSSDASEYCMIIPRSVLTPYKQYIVKVDALYRFKTASQEYNLSHGVRIQISTLNGSTSTADQCTPLGKYVCS